MLDAFFNHFAAISTQEHPNSRALNFGALTGPVYAAARQRNRGNAPQTGFPAASACDVQGRPRQSRQQRLPSPFFRGLAGPRFNVILSGDDDEKLNASNDDEAPAAGAAT